VVERRGVWLFIGFVVVLAADERKVINVYLDVVHEQHPDVFAFSTGFFTRLMDVKKRSGVRDIANAVVSYTKKVRSCDSCHERAF